MAILLITNELDITSDALIEAIEKRDGQVFRLNTENFIGDMIKINVEIGNQYFRPILEYCSRRIEFSTIRSAFYRRPIRPKLTHINDDASRSFIEAETAAFTNWLWQSLHCFWVSPPRNIRSAESKIDQLRIAPLLGLRIPRTLITNKPDDVRRFYEECNGEIVNKVLAKGVIEHEGDSWNIYTHRVGEQHLRDLELVREVPCLFQERIEKSFELRVTIVGNQVFPAKICSQSSTRTRDDWRRYDIGNTPHMPYMLPTEVERQCLALLRYYKLNFGAIDMIVTPDGEYIFLELNPNGQWLWIERLTGMPISEAIADMLIRASV